MAIQQDANRVSCQVTVVVVVTGIDVSSTVTIPPQDIIVSSKQPQRFQKSPSFVTSSTVSRFVGPLFHCPRFQLSLALQPFCGIAFNVCWNVCHNMVDTGACKRGAEGIRLRKGKKPPQSPRHTNSATKYTPHPGNSDQIMHISTC